jgi:acylaminoacyl-peptidase
VNYRGSLGVDEGFVNDLIGHVGDKDVKDMIKAIDYMSDKNLVDRQQLSLFGGSHGGFLVTHLSGQYAHWDWKACITRNPLVNIATKLDGTDIPDWGYVEAFGKPDVFAFDKVLDPMTAEVMIKKSPTNWIHNVKVPTLMLLGRKDRRVPMTQGLSYYRVLKARGVKTQCHVYDDKHDLQKVDVDGDIAINACLWILHHLK